MIIDLTVPLNAKTPVYPGDPAPVFTPAGDIERDGYRDHLVSLGTHLGTHIDAPMHILKDGHSLSEIPIEQFVGRGVCIDVSSGDFSPVLTADLQPGDIVLLYTGMANKYLEPAYFEDYPVMLPEVAHRLAEAKVSMIGLDTCSPDITDGFPIHKILLAGDVLVIENLMNLEQLIGRNFTVYALPLKLELDGAPARVIAEIHQ